MSNKAIIKEFDLGDGRKVTIETGRLAMSGPAAELKQDEAVRRAYLGY